MTELENFLFTWIPIFGIFGMSIIGLLFYSKTRSKVKVEQLKQNVKEQKKGDTFEGSISQLIDQAPDQLKQITSEIETLKGKGATPEMLKRLEGERDMLGYAVKYGKLVKPLAGTFGKVLERALGGFGK